MIRIWLMLLMMVFCGLMKGNNVKVDSVELKENGRIELSLSWENSWRCDENEEPGNWDAVWLFVKFSKKTNASWGEWVHLRLDSNYRNYFNNNYNITFEPGVNEGDSNAVGVFVYRSKPGTGNNNWKKIQLSWSPKENGLMENDSIRIQVFAIEMVYIKKGGFYLGSGGSEFHRFYTFDQMGSQNPYKVESEDEIEVDIEDGCLYWDEEDVPPENKISIDMTYGNIPVDYPKGFNDFYCMKYEITQQQYVDFLNALTQGKANNRKFDKPVNNYRYEIVGSEVGSYETSNPYVACNYLSWADGCAYSDWAGLRPMSELEFEKICRGPKEPVPNEYAWGTDNVDTNGYEFENLGLEDERPIKQSNNDTIGNCIYNNSSGPMRVGAFANGNTNRVTGGAGYFGSMEMSGNVWERYVSVGNSTGRNFKRRNGDGNLSVNGNANVENWPGLQGGEVVGAKGSGHRGGDWGYPYSCFHYISDRSNAGQEFSGRSEMFGFRCGR